MQQCQQNVDIVTAVLYTHKINWWHVEPLTDNLLENPLELCGVVYLLCTSRAFGALDRTERPVLSAPRHSLASKQTTLKKDESPVYDWYWKLSAITYEVPREKAMGRAMGSGEGREWESGYGGARNGRLEFGVRRVCLSICPPTKVARTSFWLSPSIRLERPLVCV